MTYIDELDKKIEEKKRELAELEKQAETPKDTKDFERMTFEKLKAFEKDIAEIKNNTTKPRTTREEILAIRDPHERTKAIEENLDLFSDFFPGGRKEKEEEEKTRRMNVELRRLGLDINKMTIDDTERIKDPYIRITAIEELLRRA